MRKQPTFLLLVLLLSTQWLSGQIPNGYYNSANGLTGAPLKTALYTIIKGHTALSYTALWTAFQTTDKKPDGKVWDMYSNCTFTFVADQCGNYSSECDCYNREHSWPKSWFNDATPMYTDLFHLVPTDGKVNGMRSNYPFGEVSNPTYTSGNGSKLGPCSFPGYTGTVFEPVDEYKGDFARNYVYMATRYENVIANWHSNDVNAEAILQPNSYPVFETWFLNLLSEWNTNDPVSQKEIDRNNVIYYSFQHNRNPYIDHPEYVSAVWGGTTVLPEPTNHVLSFAVNATTTSTLSLTWNDNDGAQPAGKFLILANTTGTFAAPADGIPMADDLNMSDNSGAVNVNHGAQAYTWNGLTPGTIYYFKIWPYTNADANTNYKTDGTVPQAIGTTQITAALTANPTTLSGFSYSYGSGPSASQSYSLSGIGLNPISGNITVTGSSDYEVSANNSTFSGSITISYTGGTLPATPVYVRLKSGLASGNYNNEIVTNTGGSTTPANVTCSGSVTQVAAYLTANPTILSGFSYVAGSGPSISQSYALNGGGLFPLSGNIAVTGSSHYEVSANNSTYSNSINVAYTGGTIPSTPIYVRLKAGLAAGNYNGEIIGNAGGGVNAVNVTCNGSVTNADIPQIAISSPVVIPGNVIAGTDNHILYISQLDVMVLPTTLLHVSYQVNGNYTDADIKPNGFQLFASGTNNFGTAAPLGTAQSSNLASTTGLLTFNSLNIPIAAGNSLFIWLTADISTAATPMHTITVAATTNAGYIFSAGNKTGTQSTGGTQTIVSPSSLAPGDIAFTAYQCDDPDKFSFVLLKDLSAGIIIQFTDCAWDETELISSEGTLNWTVPSGGLLKGTVVTVILNGSPTVNYGNISQDGSFQLSTFGDQILAYQGEAANPNFISGISSAGWISSGNPNSNTSYMPVELTLYSNILGFDSELDNGFYSGPQTATIEALRALLNYPANYTRSNELQTFPPWSFPLSTITIIDINSEVQHLTINAGQSFTINATRSFTVHGNLTNNSGTAGLILKSEPAGTGSLIHNTAGVPATIQRYISGDPAPNQHVYHMVSIPLVQSPDILSGLFSGSYMYQFDESAGSMNSAWIALGNSTSTPLIVNHGYRLNYPTSAGVTYNHTGLLNNGEFIVPVNFTNVEKGYNLVPNPYPSAIDWEASAGWNRSALAASIWTWNQNLGNYAAYVKGGSVNAGSQYVPTGQSFFVQTSENQSFSMNNNVRVHNSTGFAKNISATENNLHLSADANNLSDEILIRFSASASGNYDAEWDAHKVEGADGAPQLSSVSADGHLLSINSLPNNGGEEIIPLNFTLNNSGNVTFTGSGMETFNPLITIYLEDNELNKLIDLRQDPEYSFSYQAGNNPDRFKLRFSSLTGTKDDQKTIRGNAFYNTGNFNLSVPFLEDRAIDIYTFNSMGQQLGNFKMVMHGVVQIPAPDVPGIYILKVMSGTDIYISKIVVTVR